MNPPEWITFDCYDTLIDWTLDPATLEILDGRVPEGQADAFLRTFSDYRKDEESTPTWQPYRDVLRNSLRRAMTEHGMTYQESDGNAVVEAVGAFVPHSDVPPVLERLRQSCKLAIITNSDDDIVAGNVLRFGVPFDRVITSQQAGAYKPSLQTFRFAYDAIGCAPERAAHVAQDFERDMVPAKQFGIAQRFWINRYHLPAHPDDPPTAELPTLTGLPELLGL